ncbi:prepilin peptidase [Chromobacterium vaccinii]|nr:A24 family peptidase [Chromobacterium vaccinii]MBX9355840.1 A24 family peptidase [Chromobacterium vaccinii]NHQ83096.1 prepilin peptidase [Chromobacterium vaccinii]
MIDRKSALLIGSASIALTGLFSWLSLNAALTAQFATALLVLGLLLGSFLNVLAHRLPKMMESAWRRECAEAAGQPMPPLETLTLSHPRSHCPACHAPLAGWTLIPLLGYLLLRGRCAGCAAKISLRYPLVELGIGLAFFGIGWRLGPHPIAIASLVFLFLLSALALIDLDVRLLPDTLTQPLLWLGLAANLFHLFIPLQDGVIGAMAGYLLMRAIAAAFRLCTGRDGLGAGDVKLMAGLGAWLGWQQLPLIIGLGAISSALAGGALIAMRKIDGHAPQPFGPYLIGAAAVALLWGNEIAAWYLKTALGQG